MGQAWSKSSGALVMRYNSTAEDEATMHWPDGKPCTHCGTPLKATTHIFEGNRRKYEYRAPLYHSVAHNAGFCGPACVMEWVKADYVRLSADH